MTTAEQFAQAFERWLQLRKQLETNPSSVPPEQMADAWAKVMEAYEAWALSR